MQRAVSCGLEINVQCSNYKINLAPKNKQASQLTSALLDKKIQQPPASIAKLSSVNSGGSDSTTTSLSQGQAHGTTSPQHFLASPPNEADSASETNTDPVAGATPTTQPATPMANMETDTITYLNVHSGVGVGIMAGIDVGAQNRWEYLLMGQPLSHVAEAEGMAAKGELVISPDAHALLCGQPGTFMLSTPSKAADGKSLSPLRRYSGAVIKCNCQFCEANPEFMRVNPEIPLVEAVNTETPEELAEYDLYFYSEIMDRTTVAYREIMYQVDDMCHSKVSTIYMHCVSLLFCFTHVK